MSISIREFTKDDTCSIERIYNACKLDELKYEAKKFTLIPLSEDVQRSTNLWNSKIYVYESHYNDERRALGFCAFSDNEIQALFVLPTARKQGVGRRLVAHMLSLVEGTIYLNVVASNQPAIKLYEHFGFTKSDYYEVSYNDIPVNIFKMKLVSSQSK